MDYTDLIFGIAENSQSVVTAVAKVAPTHRQCDIEITNDSSHYTLSNPRMYTRRGSCIDPLPPTVQPSSSAKALFAKTPYTASGSVGIFTYDLLKNSETSPTEQIAVLFKVPFDLNLKSNVYAVGVFDISNHCNRDLFQKMSKSTDTTFVRGKAKGPSLIHKSQSVTIKATMSDCYTPVMKVQVSDN